MATMLPPVYGAAFEFDVVLFAQSDNQIKTTPTIASGDFVISKANGATANLTTTPSESPASSGIVRVQLSATEMEADKLTVKWHDAAGGEWHDGAVCIHTSGQTFNAMDSILDDILTDTGTTLDTLIKDIPTVAEFEARTIAAADYATASALATVDDFLDTEIAAILEDTGTTLPGQIAGLNNLSAAQVNAEVDAALADYDPPTKAELDAGLAGLNDIDATEAQAAAAAALAAYDAATAADLIGLALEATAQSILTDTDTTIPGLIAALNDIDAAAVITALESETLPDSYAADGAQPTYAQALLMVVQFLMERAVSGTTLTVKKPDGASTAFTLTLDDGSNPTSITRS